ncbi:MAG: hypothetical protein OXE50_08235 [Chloroflexi bacterium]|nr:hypothetical protein [Chloroflexota bacterium]
MKITRLETHVVHIPYKAPITWASRVSEGDTFVLLCVVTDEGVDGWAEALANPQWSGVVADDVVRHVSDVYEPLLVGTDPLQTERLLGDLARVPARGSSRSLVELALCDVQARSAGVPCWKYLGGWTDRVPVAWLLNRGPVEGMLEEAEAAIEGHGFRAIKVKVGTNTREDVAALGLLRDALGDDMLLWVDANSGYGPDDAMWAARGFAEVGVRFFEDPCPLDLGEQSRRLLEESPVPVMVDRQVNSAKSALDYLRHGASALNLKVGGMGYREARRVINVADAFDVPCVVGVSSETDLGSLAALHFRAAVPELDAFPAENIFFMKLTGMLLQEPPQVRDGFVQLPDKPGLGAAPSEAALERFRVA